MRANAAYHQLIGRAARLTYFSREERSLPSPGLTDNGLVVGWKSLMWVRQEVGGGELLVDDGFDNAGLSAGSRDVLGRPTFPSTTDAGKTAPLRN